MHYVKIMAIELPLSEKRLETAIGIYRIIPRCPNEGKSIDDLTKLSDDCKTTVYDYVKLFLRFGALEELKIHGGIHLYCKKMTLKEIRKKLVRKEGSDK